MKAIGGKMTYGINQGSVIECIDNTGAKLLKVISVKGYKGRKRRIAKAGVGDLVKCSVVRGDPKIRDELPLAVIVRQRKEWRRPDGTRVKFESNAAVLVNEKGLPRGSEIKGVIAKEAVKRFPAIGKIASVVV
ncbi:MAG: 50S ribosomal protein L14 [Candidatus Aenigmatarchaeota archaeon]|nr:MAG: 50S ribosomal protein L14 [Candidatus Aenigmarchaeota archaeon]